MPKGKSTFKQQFAELEAIIKKFESDDWNIEDGLEEFERALEIAKQLKKVVSTAQNKIIELQQGYKNTDE